MENQRNSAIDRVAVMEHKYNSLSLDFNNLLQKRDADAIAHANAEQIASQLRQQAATTHDSIQAILSKLQAVEDRFLRVRVVHCFFFIRNIG